MPAERLSDPNSIACLFSDGRRHRVLVPGEPAALIADLLTGLVAIVPPHGRVNAPGTVETYLVGVRSLAGFARDRARTAASSVPGEPGHAPSLTVSMFRPPPRPPGKGYALDERPSPNGCNCKRGTGRQLQCDPHSIAKRTFLMKVAKRAVGADPSSAGRADSPEESPKYSGMRQLWRSTIL